MIRIAVIEDDPSSLKHMKELLDRYQEETQTLISLSCFKNAELFLTGYRPVYDVVLMDIDLPGISGMEAASLLRQHDDHVTLIFVTAFAQYALQGYRVSATDYFVKPIQYADLKIRLDQARRQVRMEEHTVSVPIKNGTKRIPLSRIYYIETTGHILNYYTADGVFSMRGKPLKSLEQDLAADGFCRCNASDLVNLRHCEQIAGTEVLVAGKRLKITRIKRKEFIARLAETFRTNGKGALRQTV